MPKELLDPLCVVRLLLKTEQLTLHRVEMLNRLAQKERFVFRHIHGE